MPPKQPPKKLTKKELVIFLCLNIERTKRIIKKRGRRKIGKGKGRIRKNQIRQYAKKKSLVNQITS